MYHKQVDSPEEGSLIPDNNELTKIFFDINQFRIVFRERNGEELEAYEVQNESYKVERFDIKEGELWVSPKRSEHSLKRCEAGYKEFVNFIVPLVQPLILKKQLDSDLTKQQNENRKTVKL